MVVFVDIDLLNTKVKFASFNSVFFLAHMSHWLMVSYCEHLISAMRPMSTKIASKDIYATECIITELGRKDPYKALFNNCSRGSGPLHM